LDAGIRWYTHSSGLGGSHFKTLAASEEAGWTTWS
jgi:hypothetical protein